MIASDDVLPDEIELGVFHAAAVLRRKHEVVALERIRRDHALRGIEHLRNELHLVSGVVEQLRLGVDAVERP